MTQKLMIQLYSMLLNKKFFYIGALGSKKTHENDAKDVKLAGFNEEADKVNTWANWDRSRW